MLITHALNLKHVQKEAADARFLLTDQAGSFTYLGAGPFSKYGGFFARIGGELFKILEEIHVDQPEKVDELLHSIDHVQRIRGHVHETFFMPKGSGTLMMSLNKETNIRVFMDVKKPYDPRSEGRSYDVRVNKDNVIIDFTKKTDRSEDSSHGDKEYKVFVALYSDDFDYHINKGWEEHHYDYDKRRNSPPHSRWVFEALRMRLKKVAIAAAFSEKEAISKARITYRQHLSHRELNDIREQDLKMDNVEHAAAYEHAKNSLASMLVPPDKMYAGLPWFFQSWSRDNAISARGLWLSGHQPEAKRTLLSLAGSIGPEGRIPNRVPPTVTKSADAGGWVFFRLYQMYLEDMLSKKEQDFVHEQALHSAYLMQKFLNKDELDVCGPQESWMDSIPRKGALVELQALKVALYQLLSQKKETIKYSSRKAEAVRWFKPRFLHDDKLWDSPTDRTMRPNIFIAAYVAPTLLTNHEWEQAFDSALDSLWLDWGGISTIDRKNRKFRPDNTGEDAASYHNGDSWYFINCLAALAMLRINWDKYHDKAMRIFDACTKDILWMGCIGHHAELSSASEQRSEGSPAQAWSAALFIELAHALFEKRH